MASQTELYARRRSRLEVVIRSLEDGLASAVFEGVTYSPSNLEELYLRYELLGVKAAIAACLLNQSYTLGGVTFTKAQLRDLQDRERQLEVQLAPARRGFGMRMAVPR